MLIEYGLGKKAGSRNVIYVPSLANINELAERFIEGKDSKDSTIVTLFTWCRLFESIIKDGTLLKTVDMETGLEGFAVVKKSNLDL